VSGIQKVLIVGYGVMGQGVGKTFINAGFDVTFKSARADALAKANPSAKFVAQWPKDAPDLVIEFVPEDVAAKRKVYAEAEVAYPGPHTLIASGTSGMDLIELAHGMKNPERFVGLHYFMPADTSALVEVMAGDKAPREAVDRAADACERTGKYALRLYRPTIGFLVNRLQHAILHEAYYLIEQGVASAAEIDEAAKRLLAPRMCLNGLIQQKDISGLKIHADAQRSIVPALTQNNIPNPMLQSMVARGEAGLAEGKGFYDWDGCDVQTVRTQASQQLKRLMDFLSKEMPAAAPKTTPKPRDPRG
jgi:3-hydroxybutyryl-CoA dehydrogenase